MKILFITPAYKPAYGYGGPTISVSELAEALVKIGHDVTVYTTTANGETELDVVTGYATELNGVEVYYFKRITGDHTHVSPALWRKLWKTEKEFDVIHLQSWWSFLIIGAALICRLKRRSFILSPRGMLGRYSFKNQHNFSKKIIHSLVGKSLLKRSLLHATTMLEWKDCMQVYKSWKGFILPNLVNLPSVRYHHSEEKFPGFTIGFLSRIDPKKGIELMFNALSEVNFNYRLRIAGWGDEKYIDTLKLLASQLNISDRIEWCGWINGESKFRFMNELDLFVLTSYNENFAIAVTESLAMGTAVLVSENVGLADYVKEKKLGFVCKAEVPAIKRELNKIYANRNDLIRIKNDAPEIISEDFDKRYLARKYVSAYKDILGFKAETQPIFYVEEKVF